MLKKKTASLAEAGSQSSFPKASQYFPAELRPEFYDDRTKRNRFWVGGELGQHRIRNLNIAIAGLGGMGGGMAEAMARVGVGQLRIADLDRIEASNINRQAAAKESSLGRSKCHAMCDELRRISSDFELIAYDQGVYEGMTEEFVNECDAVIDEIDVFAMDRKIPLHRSARKRGVPVYTAYALGHSIHFYKFLGNEYTIEDFLEWGSSGAKCQNPRFLLEKLAGPFLERLLPEEVAAFEKTLVDKAAPIFGPITVLGHSTVVTRVLLDILKGIPGLSKMPATPVMPEYLVVDLGTMEFRKVRAP